MQISRSFSAMLGLTIVILLLLPEKLCPAFAISKNMQAGKTVQGKGDAVPTDLLVIAEWTSNYRTVSIATSVGVSAPFRYKLQKGQNLAYRVEIVAELPNTIETSKGIITYEVESTGKNIWLKYSGGLRHATKINEKNRGKFTGPFIPRIPGSLSFRYKGLSRTTNKLTINQQGKLITIKGDSQLPYLLGNLSTLVFETLPEKEEKNWSNKEVTAIAEISEAFPFHPMFFGRNSYDTKTIANESTSFAFQESQNDLVKFKRTYVLETADEKVKFKITGEGTWTFNQKLGVPESLDIKYKMVANDSNITFTLPATVKYNRLSDKEYDEYKKKQEEKRLQAKKEMAERKAPISEARKEELCQELKSSDRIRLIKALSTLAHKYDTRSNSEVAEAIKPLLTHSDRNINRLAKQAMSKFSPEFKRQNDIEEAYERSFPLKVNQVGATIRVDTSLPLGLIVAVQHHNKWRAAKILRNLEKGEFQVAMQRSSRKEIIHWTDIRLAPAELNQPFVDKKTLTKLYPTEVSESNDVDKNSVREKSIQGFRTWTDDTGSFKIVAKYKCLDAKDTQVLLERKDNGKELRVPLSRLSKEDREVVKRLREILKVTNPFE